MPNYGVAQGSLFVAFGRNLGPTGFNRVTSFPLNDRLNGISMKVRVGGTDVDCLVMNSYGANPLLATQVVGLLPSDTPVGTGTLVLTYNGQASAPASIKVIANAFGIVAVNAGGSGPARVTNADYGDMTGLDAGNPLTLNGPGGQKVIPGVVGQKGRYTALRRNPTLLRVRAKGGVASESR